MIRFTLPPQFQKTQDELERALTSIDPVATGSPPLLWNALVKLAYCDERVVRAIERAAKETLDAIDEKRQGRPSAKHPQYNQMMAGFLASYRHKHGEKATAADAARCLADMEARIEAERALPKKTTEAELNASIGRKTDQIKTDFSRAQANDPAIRAFFRCIVKEIVAGTNSQEALRLAGEAAHAAVVITKPAKQTSFLSRKHKRFLKHGSKTRGAKHV